MDKRIVCCQTKSDKLLDKTGPYVKDKISRRRMTEPKGRMTKPTKDYIKDKYSQTKEDNLRQMMTKYQLKDYKISK